jgi:glycosyltransferase involved in cell wall biosynthesis
MVVSLNVSIIIPVKNGLKWLRKTIPLFFNQNSIQEIELIILDSGSTDGLQNFIKSLDCYDIRLIKIEPKDFNHGVTRNLGVKYAKHDLLVFTVQDATPIGSEWLISLAEPLVSEKLDAICGSQVVLNHKSKNPIEWHRPIDKPSINKIELTPNEFSSLSPQKKRSFTGWDNVNAAYKKSTLEMFPFQEVLFGEDAYWAVNALNSGLKIAYTSKSKVDHYHHYSKEQFIDRYLAELYLYKKLYNLDLNKQKVSVKTLMVWLKTILKSHFFPHEVYFWMSYNLLSVYLFNQCLELFKNTEISSMEKYLSNNRTMSTNNSKI